MNKYLNNYIGTIFVMLGFSCNFQCKYCLQHSLVTDQVKAIYNPDIIDFIDDTAKNQGNKLTVHFFGGEPLLYFDSIKEIVEKLENNTNIKFSTISNGSLLDKEKTEFLKKHNFDFIISWDGKNVEETRGKNVFNDKLVKECFFELDHSGLSAVLSSANYPFDIIEGFRQINKEYIEYRKNNNLEVKGLAFNIENIIDQGLCSTSKYLTDFDFDKLYNQMTIFCNNYLEYLNGKEIDIDFHVINRMVNTLKGRIQEDNTFSLLYCKNGLATLNMDLQGNLYRCHNSTDVIGTIYSNYYSMVDKVIYYDTTKENNKKCKDCFVQDLCYNGCPLVKHEDRERYYCKMRQAFYYPVFEMLKNLK